MTASDRWIRGRPEVGEEFLREIRPPVAPNGPPVEVWAAIVRVIREGSQKSDGSQAGVWTVDFLQGSPEAGYQKRMTWIAFDPDRKRWVDTLILTHEAESRGARFVPGRSTEVPPELPTLE